MCVSHPWLPHVLARVADHKITRIVELLPWRYAATAAQLATHPHARAPLPAAFLRAGWHEVGVSPKSHTAAARHETNSEVSPHHPPFNTWIYGTTIQWYQENERKGSGLDALIAVVLGRFLGSWRSWNLPHIMSAEEWTAAIGHAGGAGIVETPQAAPKPREHLDKLTAPQCGAPARKTGQQT